MRVGTSLEAVHKQHRSRRECDGSMISRILLLCLLMGGCASTHSTQANLLNHEERYYEALVKRCIKDDEPHIRKKYNLEELSQSELRWLKAKLEEACIISVHETLEAERRHQEERRQEESAKTPAARLLRHMTSSCGSSSTCRAKAYEHIMDKCNENPVPTNMYCGLDK